MFSEIVKTNKPISAINYSQEIINKCTTSNDHKSEPGENPDNITKVDEKAAECSKTVLVLNKYEIINKYKIVCIKSAVETLIAIIMIMMMMITLIFVILNFFLHLHPNSATCAHQQSNMRTPKRTLPIYAATSPLI
jgi:hypothetical protein